MTWICVKSRFAAIGSWNDHDLNSFAPCSTVGGDCCCYCCWLLVGGSFTVLDLLHCVSDFSEGDAASLVDLASVMGINAISNRTTFALYCMHSSQCS